MPAHRKRKRKVLSMAAAVGRQVVKTWGIYPMGVHLSERFYSDDPWVSAEALAKQDWRSTDTIRRKLDELENVGRVVSMQKGRAKLYRAEARYAEETYNHINELINNANCNE